MSDKIKRLIDMAVWLERTAEKSEGARVDLQAIDWATDQLRWRRVEDDLPKDGKYLVEWLNPTEPSTHVTPIQNRSTWVWARSHGFTYWRPIELPEEI